MTGPVPPDIAKLRIDRVLRRSARRAARSGCGWALFSRRLRRRRMVRVAAASGRCDDDCGRDVVSVPAVRRAERNGLRRRAKKGGDRVEGDRPPRMAGCSRRIDGQGRRDHRPSRQPRRRRAGAERRGGRPRGACRPRRGEGGRARRDDTVEAQPGSGREGLSCRRHRSTA